MNSIEIDVFKRGNDGVISSYAASSISSYTASSPNCPKELLVEVLKREKNDNISYWVARNSNCPKEILVEILRREKDDYVSRNAANNPNCPLKEKIEWMQVTGKIVKEDPKKHIIEYENNKEDDFQDLKDLL